MDENLIGYLLDALDEPTKQQVEQHLRDHPEARQRIAVLKQALTPFALDQEAAAPPVALAERTLAKIAAHICAKPTATGELPKAPALTSETSSGGRTWWRRADVLVAASLLLMIAGIGLTVLGRIHGPSSQALVADCKNNLLQFYIGLQQYHDTHGSFPDITKQAPRNVAGMVVPLLVEAGTLPASASIRCPGNGMPRSCQVTASALRELSDDEFLRRSPTLSMCYAYSLGYRDEDKVLHATGTDPNIARSHLPIMADRPPTEGIETNSINHGFDGQNVLFCDGHISFLTRRTFGGDDIFRNDNGKMEAGVGPRDYVLGFSAAKQ